MSKYIIQCKPNLGQELQSKAQPFSNPGKGSLNSNPSCGFWTSDIGLALLGRDFQIRTGKFKQGVEFDSAFRKLRDAFIEQIDDAGSQHLFQHWTCLQFED